jgi:hypothetical protein
MSYDQGSFWISQIPGLPRWFNPRLTSAERLSKSLATGRPSRRKRCAISSARLIVCIAGRSLAPDGKSSRSPRRSAPPLARRAEGKAGVPAAGGGQFAGARRSNLEAAVDSARAVLLVNMSARLCGGPAVATVAAARPQRAQDTHFKSCLHPVAMETVQHDSPACFRRGSEIKFVGARAGGRRPIPNPVRASSIPRRRCR